MPTPDHRLVRRGRRGRLCHTAWRLGAGLAAGLTLLAAPARAWEPSAPVELVVPASTGGGADQMARFIQQLVATHRLMRQPIVVVNKPGNSGLEALLDVKAARGNPHKLVITLSNLFTAPLANGADFSWRDITPVQLMALDQFVLWVQGGSPYRSVSDLSAALRSKPPGSFTLGGTGSKQEDQLLSVMLETALGTRINYLPLKGGGDVAKALADREVDLTVNNPIEAEALWRTGAVRPLCVFDGQPLPYPAKLPSGQAWADLPTCMSAGVPVQYLMLRAIFAAPGATSDQVAYYSGVLDKVRALPEWKDFMTRGAFKPTVLTGTALNDWLDKAERFHATLMREAKLKGPAPAAGAAATPGPSAPRK